MGRNIEIDARRGGGAPHEILFGEVTIQATALHHDGTKTVFPDDTTVGISNGLAVLESVDVSPAGPEPAWAYRMTFRNSQTGRGWSEMVGVPTGSGAVKYPALPRFTTAIPPETTKAELQNWVATTEANKIEAQAEADRAKMEADRAEAPTDAMNKSLIENRGSLTGKALFGVIVESIDGKSATPMLAPVYVETRDTGMASKTPTNLRTGLSPTHDTGGGYIEELTIQVTGTKGSNVLTSAETAKVAGLGSSAFTAVLNAADGSDDFFVTVRSHNGSNQITLRKPLDKSFVGTLSSKYDAALGQHLTRGATRAYIQHAATQSGLVAARGTIIAGTWDTLPQAHNRLWKINSMLAAYGVSNSPAPVVRTELAMQGVTALVTAEDGIECAPMSQPGGVTVGTHKRGHGVSATIHTGKDDAVLEFWLSATRAGTTAMHTPRVIVTGDGSKLLDRQYDGWLTRIMVPVSGVSEVTVEVVNDNTTDTPYTLRLTNLTVREAGVSGRIGAGKIVMLGDSWFGYYNGLATTALAEKSGAVVINKGLGGMTTEWALAWFDEYVVKNRPDEVWLHFFTNDLARPTGTFTAPDGTEKPLWKAPGESIADARAAWGRNIDALIRRAQLAGVRPVVFMPGGTASDSQTQSHADSVVVLDRAPLADRWQAAPSELNDATAYLNMVGKYTGRPVMLGTSQLYAMGAGPTAGWGNPQDDAIAAIQAKSFSRADYLSEPSSFVRIGYGAAADVWSIDPVTGGTKFTVNWAASGDGGSRMGGAVSVVAGREYLSFIAIKDATGTSMNDSLTEVPGTYSSFPQETRGIVGGEAFLVARYVAGQSGSKNVLAGQLRQNGATTTFTVTAMGVIDLTGLFQDAPNLASKSDTELAQFALSLA